LDYWSDALQRSGSRIREFWDTCTHIYQICILNFFYFFFCHYHCYYSLYNKIFSVSSLKLVTKTVISCLNSTNTTNVKNSKFHFPIFLSTFIFLDLFFSIVLFSSLHDFFKLKLLPNFSAFPFIQFLTWHTPSFSFQLITFNFYFS
jgi:hypothetical protein